FAPALVQLARLYVRQGHLDKAYEAARKAEGLEPARAGYHLLSGRILQMRGHGPEAATFARFVASRWQGPDHDEALELGDSVPAARGPAGDALAPSVVADTQVVEGTVKSVHCSRAVENDVEQGYTVVIDQGGHDLTFQAMRGIGFGFSDTFWWGEDHFNTCAHLSGIRAVVHYKPAADQKLPGQL